MAFILVFSVDSVGLAQSTVQPNAKLPPTEASISRYLDQINGMTADEAVAYALAHNAEVEAVRKEVAAAKAMGLDAVPVIPIQGMTEAEKKAYVIADNRLAELAGWGTARKVAGVLGDLVADAEPPAAVVGIGVNVGQPADALPVPSATSLAALGVAAERVDVLVLVALDDAWRAAGGDAVAAGLAAECAAVCATLGSRVRVLRPGGDVLEGVAVSLAADGALRVADDAGAVRTVLAGDVEHVRV